MGLNSPVTWGRLFLYIQNVIDSIANVPARIGTLDLKKIVFNALYPGFLNWFKGFQVPFDDMRLRDAHWVELDLDIEADVIAAQFYNTKTGKFKKGEVIIHLQIPTESYEDTEAHRLEAIDSEANKADGTSTSGVNGSIVCFSHFYLMCN